MLDVISIGTATRDVFVQSRHFRIAAGSWLTGRKNLAMPLGAKLEISRLELSTGGGSTNAAVTFARQGLKTGIVCAVGRDGSGRDVISELEREGVRTDLVRRVPGLPTGYAVLLHPPGGERTVLVHRGAAESLRARDIPWPKLRTKWLYISSLAGNLELLRAILIFARRKGIAVAYNPGGRELAQRAKLIPLLGRVPVLILNREEASLLTGIPFRKEKEIFRKWDRMSPGMNVMTDGPRGAWVSDGKNLYRAGTYAGRVEDRTGSGDAFGSGLVAGLIRRDDVEYAIRLATANATSTVADVGAKSGLLSARDFDRNTRWRKLKIRVEKIKP